MLVFCAGSRSKARLYIRKIPQKLVTAKMAPTLESTVFQPVKLHFFRWFSHVPQGKPDSLLSEPDGFGDDSNPNKVNLGAGAYRDEDGQPVVFKSIKLAEQRIESDVASPDRQCEAVGGLKDLCDQSEILGFGCARDNIASIQSISGTGCLRIAAEFLAGQGITRASTSLQTWRNHFPIFRSAGISCESYRYIDTKSFTFDANAAFEDLSKLSEGTVVIMQPCAHNPTGVSPTQDQWREMSRIFAQKKLIALFDITYQGLDSGDLDKDAAAIRIFDADGHLPIVSMSFAKNMGLYGERVGTLSVACSSKENADQVRSKLCSIANAVYGSPPMHGARIAQEILRDEELRKMWLTDVSSIADRFKRNRKELVSALSSSKRDWSHILRHSGMFSFTGISGEELERLSKEHSVYIPPDGRISVAALTPKNIPYIASAILTVVG